MGGKLHFGYRQYFGAIRPSAVIGVKARIAHFVIGPDWVFPSR